MGNPSLATNRNPVNVGRKLMHISSRPNTVRSLGQPQKRLSCSKEP